MGETKMINNNLRIFCVVGRLFLKPEINLSVDVGINVVGDKRKRPLWGNKSERIANGVMN